MLRLMAVCIIACVFVAGTMCATTRRFLDVDCDNKVNCTLEDKQPVCGTDGNTYDNKCLVSLENQKKVCVLGDFNPLIIVHDGPCNDTAIDSDKP